MSFRIGFADETENENFTEEAFAEQTKRILPKKSVVQVYFAERNMTLAYYNDRFDLHRGDLVFVDGKLEGLRGFVTDVNYNFRIRLADYKRVIAVADTDVHGQFFSAGSHFVTFDRDALSPQKIVTWFKAPAKEEDVFASGSDDSAFLLDNLKEQPIDSAVAERGYDYYSSDKVVYIGMDTNKGYAIVEGQTAYEVDFEYKNGEISHLICSCFCSNHCKHEFAAMLQLKDVLKYIEKNYAAEYERSGCFAAIKKSTLIAFAVEMKEKGSFTL